MYKRLNVAGMRSGRLGIKSFRKGLRGMGVGGEHQSEYYRRDVPVSPAIPRSLCHVSLQLTGHSESLVTSTITSKYGITGYRVSTLAAIGCLGTFCVPYWL